MLVIGALIALVWLLATVVGSWYGETVVKVDDPILGYVFKFNPEDDNDGQ